MNNKIFLDSSILIEFIKGRQVDLFEFLVLHFPNNLYVNEITYSEVVYHYIGNLAKKSPLTLKEKNLISTFTDKIIRNILLEFNYISSTKNPYPIFLQYMSTYNLLPNDALILATCKLNNIDMLASFDSDFKTACKNEKIKFIDNIEIIESIVKNKL